MTYAKLLFAFGIWMIFTSGGQTSDWLFGLDMNLNRFQQEIQEGVQNLQRNIQSSVAETLAGVDRITSNIRKDVAERVKNGDYESVLSVGNGDTIISNGAGSTFISNGYGQSKVTSSGNLPNGDPYIREIEEKVVGNILHHTERFYNGRTKKNKITGYTLDLNDPNAEPVPFKPSS